MTTKKKYLTIPRLFKTIFLILGIISLFFYIKPYLSAKYLPSDDFKSVEYQSIGLLGKEQLGEFDSKTPNDLFINYYYKSLALWLGFHNYYFDLLNSISPEIINNNDYYENTRNIKIDEMLVALIQTDFTWGDLPTNIDSDDISITLGKDNKQTFYLAKKSNGNWYFTEQNFQNSETHEKFEQFMKEKKISIDNIHSTSIPVLSYLNFILGANHAYGFTTQDALSAMQTAWIPKEIQEHYGEFNIFVINKVLQYAKSTIRSVPGGVPPGTDYVMIYMDPKSTRSIYLQYQKNPQDDSYSWVFPKQVQLNAINMFLNDLPLDTPRDPFGYNIKYTIWENIPSLISKYGSNAYIIMMAIICLTLLYIIYKSIKLISSKFFIKLGKIYQNKDFNSSRKLSTAMSLAISVYLSSALFFNSTIIFMELSFYFDFIYRVGYGIIIMFLLAEITNVICSFAIALYAKSRNAVKSARFSFAITITNKLINLVIILVVAGYIVQELGIDMIHFLTALGLGGLAIALAGKDTIENLFGSIILAVERPIKIGDWVVIENKEGNVEKIGLRSTTIRTFEDSALIIPNYAFITSKINNMGERTYRRYKTMLEIDESTPIEKLHKYVEKLNELVQNTPHMKKDGYYIRINEVATDSINVLIYVFFVSNDWGEELKQRELFISEVLNIAKNMDIKFAPTQKIQFESTHN
ncbi:mechanosensitive ion channel family protein [Francisella philomiragia]|uniref:Mechanosensitive ion channel family protein n=1 Tax=Francisella philomiragia TaxID=28110 RepID=A0AAW3DC63_9GAMM|nr:mechanosensitive ion channel family protein [Francisella philomiragia]KFJ43639.1 mechanosensitive ion channel family protein [Francisella philomiragia]MBK2255015.1 mechanosensitive ion channel family protein [Francisella philomiragia]MBK2273328.1 mechanosensitive ion channel family protein [Francisella philomiragia]MBK2277313.1 mechanosensitive ion channel family protein [Francisella philomiragia]MBK2281232.1 mechanosensitive ion channel family protein [Francisella philomiragia]